MKETFLKGERWSGWIDLVHVHTNRLGNVTQLLVYVYIDCKIFPFDMCGKLCILNTKNRTCTHVSSKQILKKFFDIKIF